MKPQMSKTFMNNKQTGVQKQPNRIYTNDNFSEKSSKHSPPENSFTQNVNDCENLIENRSKMIETDKALSLARYCNETSYYKIAANNDIIVKEGRLKTLTSQHKQNETQSKDETSQMDIQGKIAWPLISGISVKTRLSTSQSIQNAKCNRKCRNKRRAKKTINLNMTSSDWTSAKAKLLLEEIDMLISRRELELQSLYSHRAMLLKQIKSKPQEYKTGSFNIVQDSICQTKVKSKNGKDFDCKLTPIPHSKPQVRNSDPLMRKDQKIDVNQCYTTTEVVHNYVMNHSERNLGREEKLNRKANQNIIPVHKDKCSLQKASHCNSNDVSAAEALLNLKLQRNIMITSPKTAAFPTKLSLIKTMKEPRCVESNVISSHNHNAFHLDAVASASITNHQAVQMCTMQSSSMLTNVSRDSQEKMDPYSNVTKGNESSSVQTSSSDRHTSGTNSFNIAKISPIVTVRPSMLAGQEGGQTSFASRLSSLNMAVTGMRPPVFYPWTLGIPLATEVTTRLGNPLQWPALQQDQETQVASTSATSDDGNRNSILLSKQQSIFQSEKEKDKHQQIPKEIAKVSSSAIDGIVTSLLTKANIMSRHDVNKYSEDLGVTGIMNSEASCRSERTSVYTAGATSASLLGDENGGTLKASECSSCGKQAIFLCAACRNIWYCSKECQVIIIIITVIRIIIIIIINIVKMALKV